MRRGNAHTFALGPIWQFSRPEESHRFRQRRLHYFRRQPTASFHKRYLVRILLHLVPFLMLPIYLLDRPSLLRPSACLSLAHIAPTSSPTGSATVAPMPSIAGLTMYRHGRTSPCRNYTGHLKPDATQRNVMWGISLPPTANQIPIRLRPACRQSLIRPFACIFIYLLPANDPLIFLCF